MIQYKEPKESFKLLNDYRYRLTTQQKKTFRGQILKGEYEAFRKGLFKVMKVKYISR